MKNKEQKEFDKDVKLAKELATKLAELINKNDIYTFKENIREIILKDRCPRCWDVSKNGRICYSCYDDNYWF